MKKNYKIGDRIFFECYDGTIETAIVVDTKDQVYVDDNGKEVPYKQLILEKGDGWSSGIEDYNCISPNSPKCKELIKKYKEFDKQKDKIISSMMDILKCWEPKIQEEILTILQTKIK